MELHVIMQGYECSVAVFDNKDQAGEHFQNLMTERLGWRPKDLTESWEDYVAVTREWEESEHYDFDKVECRYEWQVVEMNKPDEWRELVTWIF